MPKIKEFMHVRPKMVDVGRGPELARITVRRQGRTWELPAEGAKVPARRREGAFWKARIQEGCAEEFTPPKPQKITPPKKD